MLLALDTATRQLSLAMHDGQGLVAEASWRTADYHTAELAPQVALLLRRAGLTPEQLKGVALALGPGSYTGLRIGLGLAKGLALAHHLPLIGVPTFDIVMRAVAPRDERVMALVPAGRGRVSLGVYHWGGKAWKRDGDVRLLDWTSLAAEISQPTFICGEWDGAGWEHLHALRGRATVAAPADCLRRAGYLADIGWERLRRGQVDDPATLAPIYGGLPDGMTA